MSVPERGPRYWRLLEIAPGAVTWLVLLSIVGLSFRFPALVAWFVLSFDFYWLYKALVLTISNAICLLCSLPHRRNTQRKSLFLRAFCATFFPLGDAGEPPPLSDRTCLDGLGGFENPTGDAGGDDADDDFL